MALLFAALLAFLGRPRQGRQPISPQFGHVVVPTRVLALTLLLLLASPGQAMYLSQGRQPISPHTLVCHSIGAVIAAAPPPEPTSQATEFMTYLERTAVREPTAQDYQTRAREFLDWCLLQQVTWNTLAELDHAVVVLYDEMYFKQRSVADGTKLLASLAHFLSGRLSDHRLVLPRASRALASWSRQAPQKQRLPFPYIALCALVGWLLHKSQIVAALNFLIQFHTYLRPGALDGLRVRQLVRPTPQAGKAYKFWGILLNPMEDQVPGKTGLWDQAVLIDDPQFNPFLEALVGDRNPEDKLWPTSARQLIDLFQQGTLAMGMAALHPCRYGLRHGGVSEDLLAEKRPRPEAQARGGWASLTSLKRYGKQTRLMAELRKVPPEVVDFGTAVSQQLFHFLAHPNEVPPLPSLPVAAAPKAKRQRRQKAA